MTALDNRQQIARLDAADPLAACRAAFLLPDGVIYLDGNSLGPLTRAARDRVREVAAGQWGVSLVRGWNSHGWIDLPRRVGDRIGRLIGAPAGSVLVTDSTSVNLFKLLAAALPLRPGRTTVLSDTGNFPSDLYVAEGLGRLLPGRCRLRLVAPEEVAGAINDDTALVMLTEVDYRTGRRHDMAAVTAAAHRRGALMLWDLAHSAGAFPVDLAGTGADFAVGCGYKYLNGGPGAPAFLYVAPAHQEAVVQPISGWLGHAAPFAFDLGYRPAAGIDRMQAGTPPILSLAALDGALDAFDGIDMAAVRAKSEALFALFAAEVAARCPELVLASPADPARRGSQIAFRHSDGYAVMQALIAEGVIGDFRAPDIIRFGLTPLYLRFADILGAAEILERVLRDGLWRRPDYQRKAKVT